MIKSTSSEINANTSTSTIPTSEIHAITNKINITTSEISTTICSLTSRMNIINTTTTPINFKTNSPQLYLPRDIINLSLPSITISSIPPHPLMYMYILILINPPPHSQHDQ
jgi:hypothetical protein